MPRSILKAKDNMLVVLEETGGNPETIEILEVNRDTICSVITEYHPPNVKTWERKDDKFRAIFDPVKAAHLSCPDDKIIGKVEFVSFGENEGACGYFLPGKCDSSKTHQVVQDVKKTIKLRLFMFFSFVHACNVYTDDVINMCIFFKQICLGKKDCTIPFERDLLLDGGKDSCPDVAKTLAIQVACTHNIATNANA